LNRLRVNFQMKKATMPMTAMPPATARPTTVLVFVPPEVESLLLFLSAPALAEGLALGVLGELFVTTTTLVTVEP
jgi:hypothetical protein